MEIINPPPGVFTKYIGMGWICNCGEKLVDRETALIHLEKRHQWVTPFAIYEKE